MPEPNKFFNVEVTDTFGGDANYAWVKRFCVKAKSMRVAVTRAKAHLGYNITHTRQTIEGDWSIRIDFRGMNVCAFIDEVDVDGGEAKYEEVEV